jgi:hypothetical protein
MKAINVMELARSVRIDVEYAIRQLGECGDAERAMDALERIRELVSGEIEYADILAEIEAVEPWEA